MLEVIEISNPVEQDLIVAYGEREITIEVRWNDVLGYWYFNLKENDTYLAPGISGTAVNSNMLYDEFKLGKLYLVDTAEDTTVPLVKDDLGKRLALVRDYV